ncbi:MAG: HXXEE domain-containing protein [Tractidigestivibacter sp.]|jgi:hypothetical protein|uniref:HXXEE domain-containing protein n=1 Tax=Tractidigestivibacter sp. TaxID=2847320 RepID=UPI003D8AAC91
MDAAWAWFVSWGWMYVMIAMSVTLVVQMVVARQKGDSWSSLRKLGALTVIVLTFHVWEEWVIPGGFHYFYNIASAPGLRDRYPMNELTDMITNFGGAVIWFVLVELDKYGRKMSFAVMFFSFAEVAIHLLGAGQSMQDFYDAGVYTGFYGPGLVTALVCWLPLGVAYIIYFVGTGIAWKDVLGGAVILAALSFLLITFPESTLKSENTPYVFDNAGWYEQFIDGETGAMPGE